MSSSNIGSECCVCYEEAEPLGLHTCGHVVCAGCYVAMVRAGLHHLCPMCRSPLVDDYTIGISTTDYAVLLDDERGCGVVIDNSRFERIENIFDAEALFGVVGPRTATVGRLSGTTILYGAVVDVSVLVLDCFFADPRASAETREGRALRRELKDIDATTVTGDVAPLSVLMARLVFPPVLIDVIEDEEDLEWLDHAFGATP